MNTIVSDLCNEGMAKVSWPAKSDSFSAVPSLLRSDEDLKSFFQFFPESTICLLHKNPGNTGTLERKWYEFTYEQLKNFNLSGYGVFFTPCDTLKAGHKTEDFMAIRAWYCDIDIAKRGQVFNEEKITKKKEEIAGNIFMAETQYVIKGQCEALECGCDNKTHKILPTLAPSMVIESRNGFHLYWFAWHEIKLDESYMPINGLYSPSKEHFEAVEKKICERWDGDIRAAKLVQLLRLPGFYNQKDGANFLVRIRPELSSFHSYYEDEWEALYPDIFNKNNPIAPPKGHTIKDFFKGFGGVIIRNDICKLIEAIPQNEALLMLSGRPEVNGEIYTLKLSSGGRHMNININGKPSACFIDTEKNLLFVPRGTGRGSPNVIEWLKWYRNWEGKELIGFLKKVYGNNI